MRLFILLSILSIHTLLSAQQANNLRIAFYNVENLFDCDDDADKEDEEFLPGSLRRWTVRRWNHKTEQLARCIASLGEWNTPAIIGLCEVENEKVLNRLTRYSSLRTQNYRYIITDSRDIRGIDVAILYHPDQFSVISHNIYNIVLPPQERPTRDILHITGIDISSDTLDLFVCHLPSKLQPTATGNRITALQTLRRKADSVGTVRSNPRILIMGDFNTPHTDPIIQEILTEQGTKYASLFGHINRQQGTYKFNGRWELIDHFYQNSAWRRQFTANPPKATIHSPHFLFERDRKYGGKKPFRTWNGKRYQGGFSDHLPIYVDLTFPD